MGHIDQANYGNTKKHKKGSVGVNDVGDNDFNKATKVAKQKKPNLKKKPSFSIRKG